MEPENREQRRHPDKVGRSEGHVPRDEATRGRDQQLRDSEHVADEPDARAKSSGHGKKTADKWNQ